MPLFPNEPVWKITIGGADFTPVLLYENAREIVIRIDSAQTPVKSDSADVSYRQGSYLCSFQARIADWDFDRSRGGKSVIARLAFPGKVKRILDRDGNG